MAKNLNEILAKLRVSELNDMQQAAMSAFEANKELLILSPTGSGKTLAFLLPLILSLDPNSDEVQALIITPSRELAIQIEQVCREMGTGYKCNAVYGGRSGSKDKVDLKHRPAILIGTPGRVADHFKRQTFPTHHIKTLVLDEFDKSLEVGYEAEMKSILNTVRRLEKKVLTSATQGVEVPSFVGFRSPEVIDKTSAGVPTLSVKLVYSQDKDKLKCLSSTLRHIGNHPGIIFCNFKDSISFVAEYLTRQHISFCTFHGGMEQVDRERSLIKFRNGSTRILIATDLAARGLDIPELQFIIHYQLPRKEHEFVHRNGRTSRMNRDGTAYILQHEKEDLPDFIVDPDIVEISDAPPLKSTGWKTLFISGGRKDKISKGDIAGLFFKQGGLNKDELGLIEIKQDHCFVSVAESKVAHIIRELNNSKIKKRKVRISELR